MFVIDDDESVRRALSRLVKSAGLQVQTFASARAFLDFTPPDCPACLVLDLRLPGPSGLDLQSTLARDGRDIPIVFISGHGDVPSTVRAMRDGAVDFLEKPFEGRELVSCVERALTRSRAQRTMRAERAALQERIDALTPRERDVLKLVVTGRLNKQIASELGIAEKTIKVHRGRVMAKMQVGSVAELVRMVSKLDERRPAATSDTNERGLHASMGDVAGGARGSGRPRAGR